jgi:hypothetical protein
MRARVPPGVEVNALVTDCRPAADEGAVSFLIRALALNGGSIREALEYAYGHSRRHIHADAAGAFSQLTGLPQSWFEHRLPSFSGRDRWREVHLFGHTWRDDWILRGPHQQVCPRCLSEQGYARTEWDLIAYPACHHHGLILLDHCGRCGRGISPDRPALEVCSCGRYLVAESRAADPAVVQWSRLVVSTLAKTAVIDGVGLGAMEPLRGMTIDGAYRALLAFGGGQDALKGCVLTGVAPWLRSADLHDVLAVALQRMGTPTSAPRSTRTHLQRCADSLAEQKLRGVSQFDRAAAGRLLEAIGQPPKWRNRQPIFHDQLDLFR